MTEPAASPELLRLASLGRADGPSAEQAARLFAHLRRTPEEGRAIKVLLAREEVQALPDPLRVLVAGALVDRGESGPAELLLRRGASAPALMLRAELREQAGDLPGAVALWERVLLRDIDWPGAQERLARARAALGLSLPSRTSESTTMAVSPPHSPFRLVREVARGGAGTVFEAEDVDLKRRVALKVYHRADRDRAQLLHEARVAVSLGGTGVVRVFDVDAEAGWLAMEWTALGALRASLAIPVEHWGLPLARALARVHGAGWVHHDVKPANILLRAPGDPLLSDFGTARRVGEPSPPGSRGYVSPERIGGRNSDPRDDIYGYGRVVEDACQVQSNRHVELSAWRELAAACVGPDAARPRDGADLVATISKR